MHNFHVCLMCMGARGEHMQRAEGKLRGQSLPSTFLETWSLLIFA